MSRLTMMTTSEKATQKSMTSPRRSVHHTSFLWASFASARSRSAPQPTAWWHRAVQARPSLGDLGDEPALL